jgi:hypothetical protein
MKRTDFLYKIGKLLVFAEERGIPIICFTFHRTVKEQYDEFLAGRSNCDGTIKKSQHQKWLAMDFVIVDEQGNCVWEDVPEYRVLGEYWESLGGTWGGRWSSPAGDVYHMELS